jgi:hypothetical protein
MPTCTILISTRCSMSCFTIIYQVSTLSAVQLLFSDYTSRCVLC